MDNLSMKWVKCDGVLIANYGLSAAPAADVSPRSFFAPPSKSNSVKNYMEMKQILANILHHFSILSSLAEPI